MTRLPAAAPSWSRRANTSRTIGFRGLALLIVPLVWVSACGAAPPERAVEEADGEDTAAVVGILGDEAGRPLAGIQVMACMATTCLYERSDEDGRFRFSIEAPAQVVIKTAADPSQTPRLAPAMVPLALAEAARVDLGTVRMPHLPDGAPLAHTGSDPQRLAAGDGLELTLRRADLTPALGDVLVEVAARRIPPELVSPRLVPDEEELVAVYALHPFAAKSHTPMAVRAPSRLPAGTPVHFRTVDEIDGRFSEPARGLANGSEVATDPAEGISELTYLVISRP